MACHQPTMAHETLSKCTPAWRAPAMLQHGSGAGISLPPIRQAIPELQHPARTIPEPSGVPTYTTGVNVPSHAYAAGSASNHVSSDLEERSLPVGLVGGNGHPKNKRGRLPKHATDQLRAWLMNHTSHPYPTRDAKHHLMRETGLDMIQISNWFINARRRYLRAFMARSAVNP